LGDDLKGWKLAAPDTQGWQVEASRFAARDVVTVRARAKSPRPSPSPEMRPGDYALLPQPRSACRSSPSACNELPAAAAVVVSRRHRRPLRACTGHLGPVTSSPSPDGRLLRFLQHRQTVCVWSLTDLDEHSQACGFRAWRSKRDGRLVCAQVRTTAVQGTLHVDDPGRLVSVANRD